MKRAAGRLRWAVLLAAVLAAGTTARAASGPATLTVHVSNGTAKTALHLQPGFATVLRADHRVDTVAIGDPRLVTAATVKRGQDVYDIVLQPQLSTGSTNMIVWFGDITSIWVLTIGPGLRTADIVYVVTAAQARTSQISVAAPAAPASSPAEVAPPQAAKGAGPPRAEVEPGKPPQPPAEQSLEIRQTLRDATGTFQLFRGAGVVQIRYRITNESTMDFEIRPAGILVRVNGRLAPFGMSRDYADNDRPGVLRSGGAEAGLVTVPAKAARQVEIIFSLFPSGGDRRSPTSALPATFQCLFSGLDRLAASGGP